MTINDLLGVNPHGIFKDVTVLKGDFIALDAKDGKLLFDTSRNKKDYIAQFLTGEISSLWSDVRKVRGIYGDYFKPVMKCYVLHNSWKEQNNA